MKTDNNLNKKRGDRLKKNWRRNNKGQIKNLKKKQEETDSSKEQKRIEKKMKKEQEGTYKLKKEQMGDS